MLIVEATMSISEPDQQISEMSRLINKIALAACEFAISGAKTVAKPLGICERRFSGIVSIRREAEIIATKVSVDFERLSKIPLGNFTQSFFETLTSFVGLTAAIKRAGILQLKTAVTPQNLTTRVILSAQ